MKRPLKTKISLSTMRFFYRALFLVAPYTTFGWAPSVQHTSKEPVPAGCLPMADGLYGDAIEITNLAYREYLVYLKTHLGDQHPAFRAALPDTSVFHNISPDIPPGFFTRYFTLAAFANHPVVGLDWNQASNYGIWRSDVVFQKYLLRKRKIPTTWDNRPIGILAYFSGRLEGVVPDTSLRIPWYSLPSCEELNQMAQLAYEVEPSKEGRTAWPGTAEPIGKSGFKRLNDNVSEMTRTNGLACGGNFLHGFAQPNAFQPTYDGPSAWLGFRNVCRWISWKEYMQFKVE